MKSNTKLILLAIGVIITLLLCYKMAIANTISLRKEYQMLSKELLFFDEIPEQLSVLNKKKKYYDSLLSEMNIENTSIENNLLRVLNTEAKKNNLNVIDFNNHHLYSDNHGELKTFIFTLQGDFTNLLKTIHQFEVNGNFGEVIHVEFNKKKNYKTNKDFLNATIFIQNLK